MSRPQLIFDLDGTISDPAEGIGRSLNHALRAMGHRGLRDEEVSAHIGAPLDVIFRQVVPTASDGVIHTLIARYRERYAEEIDADSFQIRESLRKRVGFAQFNLLDVARAPLKRLDLIFCQNVLIYFARDRRRELLGALAGLLKPGGLLVLGAGEVTNFAHPTLSRVPHRQALAFLRNR